MTDAELDALVSALREPVSRGYGARMEAADAIDALRRELALKTQLASKLASANEALADKSDVLERELAEERGAPDRATAFLRDCAEMTCGYGAAGNGPCTIEDSDDPREFCMTHRARRILGGVPARSLTFDLEQQRARIAELEARIAELERELAKWERSRDALDAALNEGDGSYRP